ncbi:YgaP family membrane protein [Mesobacillus subterraneus]|uniref:Inner membrane protein YgaP-like transmembrane domain-containing protein n=1 Tax=Mesobacillus subterraneus TaxID=285983 RepID=A0A0D6ZEZ1_9BACI|nr:DUF2892 domain-containing protein [Mesobacillus subterraneus]KIY23183.1 hypothetical protein UB32_04115 [Mesobacillus subterraneus]
MNVRPNMGILNALVRITSGLTILAWSTAKMVKRPWKDSYLFIAMLGAMKVGEGIVRYCPMTAAYEKCQDRMEQKNSEDQDSEGWIQYNPS